MKVYRAEWVLPISRPPIRHGAVAVADGLVMATGPEEAVLRGVGGAEVQDLGRAVLLPGMVNAHTHLSLSRLAGRPGDFFGWLGDTARGAAGMSSEEVSVGVTAGLAECRRLGTAVVGEITTRAEGIRAVADDPWILARVYVEFLGLGAARARARFEASVERAREVEGIAAGTGARVRPGLSPHAPYSVRPSLWAETAEVCRARGWRWSSHVGEPPGEEEFLRSGTGPVRDYLESLGVWDGTFPVPGRSALEMLDGGGVLDERALLVHGVNLSGEELERVAATGAWLCLCPRSNAFLGLPPPPVREAFERGGRLCLGTDSRASNEDLSVWAEMRRVRQLWPGVPASAAVAMATLGGARALGFEDVAGSLEPGRAARMAVVPIPGEPVADPYEFLVSEVVEGGVASLAG